MNRVVISLGLMALGMFGIIEHSHAQAVVADPSLGTIVTPNNSNFTITGGTIAGSNLFHSFREFSIPTGGSATFDKSIEVQNIFSRITGGSISNIDGILSATSSTNLFLLNPNGILFGSGAQLNIGGSLIATTANQINFANGAAFPSTETPLPTPLLTMSVPIGLQMGTASGKIQVQGTGSLEFVPTQNLGLMGTPGATLALLGHEVTFTGGVITVPAGRLEVGSVASGEVRLIPTPIGTWQLDYTGIQNFADIALTQNSWLWNPYPVANPFGGVQVVGRNIALDRAQIAAATLGNQPGGDIQILAQNALSLEGITSNAAFPSSRISNQVLPGATGAGGKIQVQAGQIVAREGSVIETTTFGAGSAGSITIDANSVALRDEVNFFSPIFGSIAQSHGAFLSSTFANGNAGEIIVNARQIDMTGGGRIVTTAFPMATGRSGDIQVKSDQITATGVTSHGASSGIQALATGFGQGGNVKIETGSLFLNEGAIAATFAYRVPNTNAGFGNAGDIQVTARDRIELFSVSPLSPTQGSFLGSVTVGSGHGGNVTVSTPFLSIREGASLTAGTAAVIAVFGDPSQADRLGDGGILTVTVKDLEISGTNPFINNGSSLGTFTFGNGNAGNARILADRIQIRDGANILASTASTGNSGELSVQAREITIAGQKAGRDAAIMTSADQFDAITRAAFGVPEFPTGQTARLSIVADQITLSDRGKISTNHEGFGNASDLNIQTNRLSLNHQAAITTTTKTGNGGNANLQVRESLLLRNGSRISTESNGSGNGGNIAMNAKFIIGVNNSDITANAVFGNGGMIDLTTQGLIGISPRSQLTSASDITASSRFGFNGTIQVNTIGINPNSGLVELPANLADLNQTIADGCDPNQTSRFVITGRGGMPSNPIEQVERFDLTWKDLRTFSPRPSITQTVPPAPLPMEATAWHRDPQTGTIELTAPHPVQSPQIATCH